MVSKESHSDTFDELCAACGTTQPHEVAVKLRTESEKDHNAEFSREPYRVSTCRTCGSVSRTRMNDA